MTVEVRVCEDRDEYERAFLTIGQYFGMEPGSDTLDRFIACSRSTGCTLR